MRKLIIIAAAFGLGVFVGMSTGCHGGPRHPFIHVECIGDEIKITYRVPGQYEAMIDIDGQVVSDTLTYGHDHITLPKESVGPGVHTTTITYTFVGPPSEQFPNYRPHGEVFTKEAEFEIDGPAITSQYYLCPIYGSKSPPKYLMRLDGFVNSNAESSVTFDGDEVRFTTYEDGTATIIGEVRIRRGGEGTFDLDVFLIKTGDGDGLEYYDIQHGLLVNVDDPTDTTDLVGYGPPARVGYGGNGKNENFGFSGWVNYARSNGNGSLDEHRNASDFLGDLNEGSCAEGEDEINVEPVVRVPNGHGSELQTVFVFHARGPKKNKPTVDECFDTNENQDFSELGFRLSEAGLYFNYHPIFEPTSAFNAIDRSFSTWETEAGNVFDFAYDVDGTAGPDRDGLNVVGWRRFVGAGGGFLAAAFITENGAGEIVEVDIFFNLKHKWSEGPVIAPGDLTCGNQYDIQAVSTHEVGHALGLGHVASGSDATMAPSAGKGELMKQTLTPGDAVGAVTVTTL